MDKKLKSALKQSFTPPKPTKINDFINSISYPKASFNEVFMAQVGFIRKRVWISFFSCLIFAYFYTNVMEIPTYIITGLSALLPLFSLITVTEIFKSAAFNMEEMELACKYSLSKIALMRLGILGAVSFMILILCVTLAEKSNFGMFRNLIYLSVPYLISTNISLAIIAKTKNKETIYICTTVSGAVSIFMLMVNSNYTFIYHFNFTTIWCIVFIALIGIMAMNLIRFKNSQEELQWNLS